MAGWNLVSADRTGVCLHLHGTGYRCGSVAKVFGRFPGPRRHNIPILLGPRRYHEYCRYRVQFEITKQWKGTPSKSSVVITRITGEACGFPFEEKKGYLMYVVTEPKDIQTGICTGTKNIAEAEQEMKELDKLLERSSHN